MTSENQSFNRIASFLVKKDTQNLADELLILFCDDARFDNFINAINLIFIQDIRNINYNVHQKQLTSSVLRRFLKYHFCARLFIYALRIVKRNQIYNDILLVRDILHAQKETSVLIFLQCRTDAEIRVFSKILRGKPPIRRGLAIDALAKMCAMRYQYMNKYFCNDDIVLNCSEKLRMILDTYPNYTHVAQLLRVHGCDLVKVLRNVKVTIDYPVKQRFKNLKTFQVHMNCKKKTVKFFYPAYQQLHLVSDNNLWYRVLKPFINVKNECILELEFEEIETDDENATKWVIVYPYDILLIDGHQCINLPTSSRYDILSKIIYSAPRDSVNLDGKIVHFSLEKICRS